MIVVAIIGIISALGVPVLVRARMSSNEASAIGSLRVINSAQSAYRSSCGNNGYAQSLADLAKQPAASSSGFISPDLAIDPSIKSGYIVHLEKGTGATDVAPAGATCNRAAASSVSSYFAEANPVTAGSTGRRAFGTDGRGTIYSNDVGSVMVEADLATAPPIQ